jgi:tetratricopeptide (TPR) repeat protein
MKKLLVLAVMAVSATGCMTIQERVDRARYGDNPYLEPPFYARYLDTRFALDQQIEQRINALAADPNNPTLHNELGQLLVNKGFPKDATREFQRAIFLDEDFYPAWYNLALIRHAQGDRPGATRALRETIDLKPGHAAAHFQLGLIYEQGGKNDAAVHHYAKAFAINPHLLDIGVNPRILDSKLVDIALLEIYPVRHRTKSIQFQQGPRDYVAPSRPEAPSPQPRPEEIVPPSAPTTDPGTQTPPPNSR